MLPTNSLQNHAGELWSLTERGSAGPSDGSIARSPTVLERRLQAEAKAGAAALN